MFTKFCRFYNYTVFVTSSLPLELMLNVLMSVCIIVPITSNIYKKQEGYNIIYNIKILSIGFGNNRRLVITHLANIDYEPFYPDPQL